MTDRERNRREEQSEEALEGGVGAAPAIEGVKAIARFLNKTERQTFYLCETGAIPAFRLGSRWHLRPSTYARFVELLEERALEQKR